MCSQSYNYLPARGDAGTYPSHQRCCAASASHSGETQGDASPPPVRTSPAPTRLFYYGSQISIKGPAGRVSGHDPAGAPRSLWHYYKQEASWKRHEHRHVPLVLQWKELRGRPLALIRLANAGSCPSRQRDCVASASRSAETKGTAQLVLRTQARRKEQGPPIGIKLSLEARQEAG